MAKTAHVWMFTLLAGCPGSGTIRMSGATTSAGASSGSAGTGSSGGMTAGTTGTGGTSGTTSGGIDCPPGTGGASEFSPCSDSCACAPGLSCVADPAFAKNQTSTTVCEMPCKANADCPNAVSLCKGTLGPSGGSTCEVNTCDPADDAQIVGSPCDSSGNGGTDGTCVLQTGAVGGALICLPNGTATSCAFGSDDNPGYSVEAFAGNDPSGFLADLAVVSPQPRTTGLWCPAGMACEVAADGGGGCATLCVPGQTPNPCTGGTVCVTAPSSVGRWGFCGACTPSPGACNVPSDCCAGNCTTTNVCGCFASGTACNRDGDCCSHNCNASVCG